VGVFTGRLRRLGVPAPVVASVAFVVARMPARADVVTSQPTGAGVQVAVLGGDFTGDGKADLAVTGSQYFSSLPVAASTGDGSFTTPPGTLSDPSWAGWSSVPGVRVQVADFNGDGKDDIAAEPGKDPTSGNSHAPWNSDAHAYLVYGHQAFGVNLTWFDPSAPLPGGRVTQPPAAPAGVGVLQVFNCSTAGHPVSVWTKDTSVAGSAYQRVGNWPLPYQAGPDGGCAAKDSDPLTFTPPTAHDIYQVTVTDPQAAGCTADDPNNPACVIQPESRAITGNPAGAIETQTVGQGTDRSPFASNRRS
jgi:hypothetical protein